MFTSRRAASGPSRCYSVLCSWRPFQGPRRPDTHRVHRRPSVDQTGAVIPASQWSSPTSHRVSREIVTDAQGSSAAAAARRPYTVKADLSGFNRSRRRT